MPLSEVDTQCGVKLGNKIEKSKRVLIINTVGYKVVKCYMCFKDSKYIAEMAAHSGQIGEGDVVMLES